MTNKSFSKKCKYIATVTAILTLMTSGVVTAKTVSNENSDFKASIAQALESKYRNVMYYGGRTDFRGSE